MPSIVAREEEWARLREVVRKCAGRIASDRVHRGEKISDRVFHLIERLNPRSDISAYLFRRTISRARTKERLEDNLELLRCYYSLLRPHSALYSEQGQAPAMQTGLTARDIPGWNFACFINHLGIETRTSFKFTETDLADQLSSTRSQLISRVLFDVDPGVET
jgi:hypothetical protein